MRARLLLTAAVLALGAAGCGSDDDGASDAGGGLRAVATTTHAADLLANLGGERVDVHTLLTPTSDPHEYEPRPSDARAVAEAALVVRSGGDLDEWLGDVVENAGGDAEVLTLMNRVRTRGDDPHWWQDPRNAVLAVEAIGAALAEADPEGAAEYRRSVAAYARRIESLDADIAACMAAIPGGRRKLVTTHDSYGYFAARYDIEVVGAVIPSLSSQARPSAGDTAALVRQIREEDVAVIFPESALDPRLERAVADEAGAEVGESLYADSLGPEGSEGDTYLGALAHDAKALARGFTGGARGCDL
ncbi:MAG: metal ABC transporter substrate-binding protein [Thermoleophilaceae bacterium]